jgi:hypothetical protein
MTINLHTEGGLWGSWIDFGDAAAAPGLGSALLVCRDCGTMPWGWWLHHLRRLKASSSKGCGWLLYSIKAKPSAHLLAHRLSARTWGRAKNRVSKNPVANQVAPPLKYPGKKNLRHTLCGPWGQKWFAADYRGTRGQHPAHLVFK